MAVCSWSWKELYDQTGMSEDMSFILFTDCFPCTHSTYPDWLALGKPRCWCAPPAGSGTETFFKYRVYGKDLATVVTNWKKKDRDDPYDPTTQLPGDCPRSE